MIPEIPEAGLFVRWRYEGHELLPETDILRFEVTDVNRVITRAAREAPLYRHLQDQAGQPADWQVLVLSCFAVDGEWDPIHLAAGTAYSHYHLARAADLLSAGYELWPTEIFIDAEADDRNSVHYDLVVAAGPDLLPSALLAGSPAERRAARLTLAPLFEGVYALLGTPKPIPSPPSDETSVQ